MRDFLKFCMCLLLNTTTRILCTPLPARQTKTNYFYSGRTLCLTLLLIYFLFLRSGLIPSKSYYLPTQIKPNKNRCLQVSKQPGRMWIQICSKEDKRCSGDTMCNLNHCYGLNDEYR